MLLISQFSLELQEERIFVKEEKAREGATTATGAKAARATTTATGA